MVGVNVAIGKRAVGLQLKGLHHTSSCMTTLTIPYPPDTLRPTIPYPPDTLPLLAVPPSRKAMRPVAWKEPGTRHTLTRLPRGQTDTCENITFPCGR